jgi:1-deoxy-D-xylulose-5-phosphate synthase
MVSVAQQAAQELAGHGISCGVANARYAKPLDLDLLRKIATSVPRILTLEEHLLIGGFGAGVLEAFHAEGLPTAGLRVHAIPDVFVEHSPQLQQRHNLKLDVEGVVETVMAIFPDLSLVSGAGTATPEDKKRKFAETVNW